MEQPDLWGVSPPLVQPADTSRRVGLTCWEKCGYCEPNLLRQNKPLKVYRLCSRIGSKCYLTSELCEWSDFFEKPESKKPQTPGWDDF
jgi:hypothetical protein